jgi:hypothetical protein
MRVSKRNKKEISEKIEEFGEFIFLYNTKTLTLVGLKKLY